MTPSSSTFSSSHPVPPRAQTGKLWLTAIWVCLGLGVIGTLVLAIAAVWYYPGLPPLDKVTSYQPQQAMQVYTSDNVEIAQFGSERRDFLPIAQIPKLMQDALLAVEDARFREHSGIDPIGILRAVVSNLTGGRRQGASTITQQVARNFFLSNRKTAERKLKEAMLAIKIEHSLSKDEILELYMNQIYLGHRAYGFSAAAQVYFGKTLPELSVAEVAMLAGLPQNPAFANPISNMERATRRQQLVLGRMLSVGVIDQAQFDAATKQKLVIRSPLQVPVHAEYVAEMARQAVFERYGQQAYSQGIKVYTSLIAADQQAAYQALRKGVLAYDRKQAYRGPEENEDLPAAPADATEEDAAAAQALKDYSDDEDLRVAIVLQASPQEVVARLATGETLHILGDGLRWAQPALSAKAQAPLALRRGAIIRVQHQDGKGGGYWAVSQWPEVQSALVSLTPQTGRVRALVGGFDFSDQQFNHVTQGSRQPGSSFKPFIYSAGIDKGVMPSTLVNDAPLNTPAANGAPAWNPQNDDGQFLGPVSLRQGLFQSRNLVSIRLLQFLGVQTARDWAARFGFDIDKQPDNLTLALGTGSTTPLQLASAYSVFANGGHLLPPVVIERITDAQGKLLFEAPPAPALTDENRVLPERNVFITNSLLQSVTSVGTAAKAQATLKRPDLYGKTGTTNDAIDTWFAGFQPTLATVVWMGYDTPRSLGSTAFGATLSLPIWIDYMGHALKGVPVAPFEAPSSVMRDALNDWTYTEPPENGELIRIGFDEPAPDANAAPAVPAMQPVAPVVPATPATR
ncbi:MAG: PBP1A family penicillin-binding protein [Burkholderiales bacterium]|nr:PBP1A family penicillin-binding protein [Burkholderiales bacterium]